jgi:hypothetical protein
VVISLYEDGSMVGESTNESVRLEQLGSVFVYVILPALFSLQTQVSSLEALDHDTSSVAQDRIVIMKEWIGAKIWI